MRDPQQHAIETYAFYKASTMLLWSDDHPMHFINYIAKRHARYAIEEATDYITDRCYDLSDDEDIDIETILRKHDGYQYYEQVLAWIERINEAPGEIDE